MSSSPPTRPGSRLSQYPALFVLVMILQFLGAPIALAQPQLVVVPGGALGGQLPLLVTLPVGSAGPSPGSFSVAVEGVSEPVQAVSLLSDRLAMSVVVDASAEGRPVLPAGLSGAANFVLAVPPAARIAIITDSAPPVVAAPLRPGPAGALSALSGVRSAGDRRTGEAVDLAVAQLPVDAAEPRLVVLVTAAPDAGSEPAVAIGERMRTAGVQLAVVSTAAPGQAPSPFWSAVAARTGGAAVSADPAQIIPAFDRLLSMLGTHYVLTMPAPSRLPATASVRLAAPGGPLTAEVTVEEPEAAGLDPAVAAVIGVAVVAVAVAVIVLLRRRAGRDAGGSGAGAAEPARAPPHAGRSTRGAAAWNIPDRLGPVVDREPLLAELAATLHVGRPVWLRPGGRTGLGASTAMIDFAHRHRDRYDIAWWIPALDPDLVPERLAELAETLGLATHTDSAETATAALLDRLRNRDRWLLVLDDAESARELARFLPGGPGDVVVISTDRAWEEHATPVTVRPFLRAESVSLLRAQRPGLTTEVADRIADDLDDLPLAVGPAAALLADTDMDVDTFRRRLGERKADLPEVSGDLSAALWAIALDRLAAADPQALALLTAVAWLGPEPVPLSLITRNADRLPDPLGHAARNDDGLVERAATLRRRGLARVTGDSVTVHPLPAAQLAARSEHEYAREGGWPAITVRLLRAAVPDRPAADPAGWPAWRRLLPHVLAVTDPARRLDIVAPDVGWLLGHAAGYLAARGLAVAARALYDDAHQLDIAVQLRSFGDRPPGATRQARR